MHDNPCAHLDPAMVRPHTVECLRRLLPDNAPRIDDVLDPIKDLGLESLDGINFIVLLGVALDHEFPPEFNPFFDSGGRSRSIGQIVEGICRKLPPGVREVAAQPLQP